MQFYLTLGKEIMTSKIRKLKNKLLSVEEMFKCPSNSTFRGFEDYKKPFSLNKEVLKEQNLNKNKKNETDRYMDMIAAIFVQSIQDYGRPLTKTQERYLKILEKKLELEIPSERSIKQSDKVELWAKLDATDFLFSDRLEEFFLAYSLDNLGISIDSIRGRIRQSL